MTKKTPVRRTRNLKTPKQRAQETLESAKRRADSLDAKLRSAREALTALEAEHRAAVRRLRHAEANPDLNDEDDTELPFEGGES